jgi:hypothetical protein
LPTQLRHQFLVRIQISQHDDLADLGILVAAAGRTEAAASRL